MAVAHGVPRIHPSIFVPPIFLEQVGILVLYQWPEWNVAACLEVVHLGEYRLRQGEEGHHWQHSSLTSSRGLSTPQGLVAVTVRSSSHLHLGKILRLVKLLAG